MLQVHKSEPNATNYLGSRKRSEAENLKLGASQAVPCTDRMEVQGQAEQDSQAEKATLEEERHH